MDAMYTGRSDKNISEINIERTKRLIRSPDGLIFTAAEIVRRKNCWKPWWAV